MLSTASIENANPVTTELSWKTVKKGYRSATRRPRKINRSLNIGLPDNDKGSEEEPSVAESEEFGLALLGHHFSEKIDHLPIKKRRSVQQSPSSSPHIPFNQWRGEPGTVVDGLVPNERSVVNKKPLCSEDSYGIELLAAAACATSITDEILNVNSVKVEEKSDVLTQSDVSIKVTSLEETIICSQKQNSLLKAFNSVAHDGSREKNNSLAVSGDIYDERDVICSQKQSFLLNDVNSVAHDDSRVQNNLDILDKSDTAGKGSSLEKCARLHWDLNTVMDEWEIPSQNMNTNSPRNLDIRSESLPIEEIEKVELSAQRACEPLNCPLEVKSSAHVIGISKCPDNDISPALDLIPVPSESPFEENMNPSTTKMALKVEANNFLGSDLQLGQTLVLENLQLGKQDVAMVNPTISDKSTSDVVKINSLSELPKDTNTAKLEKAGPSFEKGGDLVGKLDVNVHLEVGPSMGSSSGVDLKKLDLKSCKLSGEAALDYFLDDEDVSDYSPGGHYHFARIDKMSKYQPRCDSPVEDGELRESLAYSWQENEDETDFVEYDMDDGDAADDFAVGNHCVSKAGSSSNRIDSNEKMAEKGTPEKHDFSKELNRSRKPSGWDQIPEGCERVAKTIEANNGKLVEVGSIDSTRRFVSRRSLEEKVGSRPARGRFSSHVQRLSVAFGGKDSRDGQRSSAACIQDGQVNRFDKYPGRDRSWVHDVKQKNNQDADVSRNWGSRNHYQNDYRRGGGNPKIRSSNASDTNDDDIVYNDHRRTRGNYSRGGYRPINRSPDDNGRGNFATREDSNYRNRGRSGYYRRGFAKGNRDEFHESIADDSPPPRRKYSTSPVVNRDDSFYRLSRKSPSGSRSRSPVPWQLRNGGRRQISRSPDFRSEGRMGKNKYLGNGDVFRGFSNDRNSGPARFKQRNSPFFGQRQRFGSNGTVGRMNSERLSEQSGGGWRAHNNNNSSNNNSYDGSDSERPRYNNNNNNNKKHEMIRRARHGETSGDGSRFSDDCLESHYTRNEYNNNKNRRRSSEKNIALGSSFEGRRRFKHDGDRVYTTSSRVPGNRNYEDAVSADRR